MREKISELMDDIARENGIKILFAIENGSRAWDMASADSDYDIRFVFFRPVDDYLTLSPKEDVIVRVFTEDLKLCDVSGSVFDMPADVFNLIKEVIQIKSSGKEKEPVPHIRIFDDYFTEKENEDYAVFSDRQPDKAVLEKELKRILAEQKS